MDITVVLLVLGTIVSLGSFAVIGRWQKKRETQGATPPKGRETVVPSGWKDDAVGTSGETGTPERPDTPLKHPATPGRPQDQPASAEPLQARNPAAAKPMVVRIILTMILLAAALYVILSNSYDGDSKNWAFGVVGTIVGYWLRSEGK